MPEINLPIPRRLHRRLRTHLRETNRRKSPSRTPKTQLPCPNNHPGKHQRRLLRCLHERLPPRRRIPRKTSRRSPKLRPPRPRLGPLPPRRRSPPYLPLPLRQPRKRPRDIPQTSRLQSPERALPSRGITLETRPQGGSHPAQARLRQRWLEHPALHPFTGGSIRVEPRPRRADHDRAGRVQT